MGRVVSVSIKDKIHDLAREKAIKWSEALERGVLELAYGSDDAAVVGEKEEKVTDLNKLMQMERDLFQKNKAIKVMQEHILKLEENEDG